MAKTKLAKKRRLQRARTHQVKTRTEPTVYVGYGDDKGVPHAGPMPDELRAIASMRSPELVIIDEIPTRAKCPQCGTRQKVRTDGTFGKHRTTLASDPLEAVDCAGVGQLWNAA